MLTGWRSRIAGFVGIAMLVLTMVVTGCGRDDGRKSDKVTVRSRKKSAPARKVATPKPPAGVTETAVIEKASPAVPAPEEPKVVTYDDAEAAYHAQNYDEAVELFTSYTEQRSENPWGFYMLGLSARKTKDYEAAEKAFEQALEIDPHHVKSWLNLSRVLLDTERPDEALVKIDQALEIDPESYVAYRLKGRAYHQLGRNEEAVAAYRKAIQIDDQDAWSMNNMGLVFIQRGLYDKALPPLARAVEIKEDAATFWNNLGIALECTGHIRAAEDAFNTAIKIDGSYEKAYTNRDRVDFMPEEPGLEPIDLAAVARSFVEDIESSRVASEEKTVSDSVEVKPDTILVSEVFVPSADSTGSGNNQ
jgi:Flp pilus assembly protein TadD